MSFAFVFLPTVSAVGWVAISFNVLSISALIGLGYLSLIPRVVSQELASIADRTGIDQRVTSSTLPPGEALGDPD